MRNMDRQGDRDSGISLREGWVGGLAGKSKEAQMAMGWACGQKRSPTVVDKNLGLEAA